MKTIQKVLTVLLGMMVFSTASSEGDPMRGQEKSAVCVACHSTDGNSAMPEWPKIAGQHEVYLLKQLRDFKLADKGGRNNAIMYGIIGQMSDQDLADFAAYYSQQKMSASEADPAYVDLGRQIYHGGLLEKGVAACAACHAPSGEGNQLTRFPKVSGQWAKYLSDQLIAFRDGVRTNGAMMVDIAQRMSEDEMLAVSSYMAGLQDEAGE